jgi:hypothetical protein
MPPTSLAVMDVAVALIMATRRAMAITAAPPGLAAFSPVRCVLIPAAEGVQRPIPAGAEHTQAAGAYHASYSVLPDYEAGLRPSAPSRLGARYLKDANMDPAFVRVEVPGLGSSPARAE